MKKFSVVLLVAVLAVSSVFAALTGYVQAKYQIDFDNGVFGYKDPANKGDLEAKLSFDSLNAAKKGESKVYVDAAASFNFTAKGIDDGGRYGLSRLGYFQLSVDKLSIVGEDWTWNLLEAEQVGGYADSTMDFHTWYRADHYKGSDYGEAKLVTDPTTDTDSKYYYGTYDDDYADYAKKVAYGVGYSFYDGDDDVFGTTFKKGGYTVALALNGHFGDYDYKKGQQFYLGVESKEFELGDAKVQAAFGASYMDGQKNFDGKNDRWTIGASFKADYATDAFAVKVATDQTIATYGHETAKKKNVTPTYNGDVLVQTAVGPVSADVFFAKNARSKKGDDTGYNWMSTDYISTLDEEDINFIDLINDAISDKYYKDGHNKKYFSKQGVYKENYVKNLFSFQIAADLNEFDVPVTVKFQALNMVNDAKIFNVVADAKLGDLSLSVYGKDLLASYEKVYGDKAKAYYKGPATGSLYKYSDFGSYYYWKENGNKQKLGIDAAYVVDEALTVKAGFFAQLGERTIGANVGATYVADLFTADASLAAEFLCAEKSEMDNLGKEIVDADEYNKMQLKVSVKSDKIVDGAVLSIAYESGNLIDNLYGEFDYYQKQQAGVLTTKCKVTF